MATTVVKIVCYLLFRLLLPVILLASAVVRFNVLSFLYTIFLLLCPLLSSPTAQTIRGGTGVYLRVIFIVGLLAMLAHAVFHITLSAIATTADPYGSMFPNCSTNERLARQIGVERLDSVPTVDIIRLVLPDVAVFVTGLLVYVICYKLLPAEPVKSDVLPTKTVHSQRQGSLDGVLQFIGEFVLVLLLAASGIIVPSAISAVYFLSFIFVATSWSLYGSLGVKFSIYRTILLIYSAAHILALHLYQFQFFQDALAPDDFISRLLGLTSVVVTHCDSPERIYFYDTSKWPNFVNPAILLFLYYTLAFEVRRHCHGKTIIVDVTDGEPLQGKHKERRRQQGGERQVPANLDESQKEHLVEAAEVPDYSSIQPVITDRSGSPSMLAEDDRDQGGNTEGVVKTSDDKRAPLASVLVYIMHQSYVLSLIAMMAWSITFHSWLTFVLLLAACIIWMFPNSRRLCYILSPVILFYGVCLLIIQFIYGMNLTDKELPREMSGVKLADIGLKKFPYPCLQLALQVLYALMFWLTLRQFIREKRQSILAEEEKYPLEPLVPTPSSPRSLSEMFNFPPGLDSPDGYDSNTMLSLGQYMWCMLCKYWIFLCTGMLLLISLQEVVIYRIVYMILFLAFILSFQFAYRFWRLTMFLFWWVVIVYSMIVLIILYTYQFDNIAQSWQNSTGLSNDTLADIGLEKFDTAGLFVRLLTPTSFLIFIIIQVHYFHKPFLLLSDLNRFISENKDAPPVMTPMSEGDTATATDTECGDKKKKKPLKKRLALKFSQLWVFSSKVWETITWFLWRLAEIHIFKAVAFVIMVVTVYEVSAISAVYVILLAVFLPLTGCQFLLSHIIQFWTALVLLSKMIYQLNLVDKSNWLSQCDGSLMPTLSPGATNGTTAALSNLTTRAATTTQTPVNTTQPLLNASLTTLKSLVATTEVPFNATIDNAIWVGLNKTDNIAYYLRNYIGILLILVLERIVVYHQKQYYNTPGLVKPKSGIIFPDIKRSQADLGIIECAKYFMNYFFYKFGLELCYIMTAITICIRVDVVSVIYALFLGLLLLLSRHGNAIVWPIYTIVLVILLPVQFVLSLGLPLGLCYEYVWDDGGVELKRELEKWLYLPDYDYPPDPTKLIADFFQLLLVCLQWRVFRTELGRGQDEPDGGNNDDITSEVEAMNQIPVEDFTTKITSYLDVIKNFVFTYMFWVTLAIVFIAGTTRINLFSMGYVIAVFCFMWFGQEFLIKPLRQLCRAWNFLLGYCYIVLLLKAALQLPGCVYIQTIVDNACWLVQLLGLTCLKPAVTYPKTQDKCTVEDDNTGLAWDVVCFTFLLLQRRIYMSHYFRHVVADFEAQNRLASRGCQLINRILIQEVAKQKQEEMKILLKIKEKMNQLKQKQTHLKKDYIEPEEHFQAIRSGDYYLFEDSEDEEGVTEEGEVDTITFGTDKDTDKDTGPSPLQLISTAVTSGADEAVKQAEEADKDGESSKPTSPKPSGSQPTGEEQSECKDTSDKESETSKGNVESKVLGILNFILALLGSCADWITGIFNRISRNYRLVAAKLKDDHIRVKQQIQSEHRKFKENPVELQERSTDGAAAATTSDAAEGKPADTETSEDLVLITVEPVPSGTIAPAQSEMSLSALDLDKFDEEEAEFQENQPRAYRLLVATYLALVSRSELVCYFLMILNHILSASLLSLPLPMLVFLWGMLSVPRPTKTFWITVITYTEAVVVVKYLFQFGFFPWNDIVADESPFWPPKIIGIEQKNNFASMDLVLLLALFIHRSILKHILKCFEVNAVKLQTKIKSIDRKWRVQESASAGGLAMSNMRYGLWKDEEEPNYEPKEGPSPTHSSIEETPEKGINEEDVGNRRTSSVVVEPSVHTPPSLNESSLERGQEDEDKKGKKSVVKELFRPFINFYKQLTCPDYSATTDVYASMFICDFINFLIIVFGYTAFGPSQTAGGGDVTSYISEDRVPVLFLVMLLAQFVLIIIDRALYLRKNVLGKFIFQILLVIVIHIWMFFILPYMTKKPFTENKPAQLWYFIKCVYFALSAYQIRSAYPTRILGNFLTKKYNYINLFLFKGFLAIPFLLELRVLMDWMWTNTTMAVGSWLQMEDIYANIYVLKCFRVIEKDHPTPRAQPKPALIKYGVGGLLLFVVIFIIWFPLVIFSFANTVYVPNPPTECSISVTLAGYQPLFMLSGQQQNIRRFTDSQYQNVRNLFDKDAAGTSFLTNYEAEDITETKLDGKSTSLWGISPPSYKQLLSDLRNKNTNVVMEFHITFNRVPNPQAGESLSQQFTKVLTHLEKNQTADMINGTPTDPVLISKVFPEYIRLGSKVATPATALLGGKSTAQYTDITIELKSENASSNSTMRRNSWWEILDKKDNHKQLTITTFNDRVAPSGISFLAGYGIIGLYVTFILLIGRILRVSTTGQSTTISFRELPYVDNMLRLCLDLYLVREMQEFRLEEDLYAKLIFVYRSAETRVRWTRMPMSQIIETKKNL